MKVNHRDIKVNISVPKYIADAGKIECTQCVRTFANKQGLVVRMTCIQLTPASMPASSITTSSTSPCSSTTTALRS